MQLTFEYYRYFTLILTMTHSNVKLYLMVFPLQQPKYAYCLKVTTDN